MRASISVLLLVPLILFVPAPASAQAGRVEGSVRATEDGRPLEGIEIRVEGDPSTATSGGDGTFVLPRVPPGRRTLVISGLGVATTRRELSVEAGATTVVQLSIDLRVSEVQGITVRANRTPDRTTRIPVPRREIPLSVATVDRDRIELQGVDDMPSVLENVTGVRPIETYGGFQHYSMRGFRDFVLLVDGFRDERHNISTSAPMSNLATVDRVEVLKGPASVLYGHSALGGVINILRKQPEFAPAYALDLAVGSFDTRRIAVGATGPLSDEVLYRLDAGVSEDEGWREAGSSRSTAQLALRWLPTEADRVDLQIGAMRDEYRLDAGIPTVDGEVPSGVPLDARYNSEQDFMDYDRQDVQASWEHRFSPSLSMRNQTSYAWDDYLYLSTEYLEVRPEDRVYREWFQFDTRVRPFQHLLEVTHEQERGDFRFRTLAGYTLNHIDRTRPRDRSLGAATEVDLFAPVDTQPPVQIEEDVLFVTRETVHGIYLQEFLEVGARLRLLGGVRVDFIDGHYRTDILETSRTTAQRGTPTERSYTPFTFRTGAVWELSEFASLFAGYSTFFKQPRQIPADGSPLDPETGWQAESGVRYDPSDRLSLTLTGFKIRKEDALVPLGQGNFSQAGAAESEGIELDGALELGSGLRVTGGYSYTDATYTSYGGFTGNRIEYAPDHQAHVWADYRVLGGPLRGLILSLGANHVGDNWAGRDNDVLIPAYTVWNGAVAYRFGDATLSLHGYNLADAEFFTTAINGFQLYPGAPRNLLLRMGWAL